MGKEAKGQEKEHGWNPVEETRGAVAQVYCSEIGCACSHMTNDSNYSLPRETASTSGLCRNELSLYERTFPPRFCFECPKLLLRCQKVTSI